VHSSPQQLSVLKVAFVDALETDLASKELLDESCISSMGEEGSSGGLTCGGGGFRDRDGGGGGGFRDRDGDGGGEFRDRDGGGGIPFTLLGDFSDVFDCSFFVVGNCLKLLLKPLELV